MSNTRLLWDISDKSLKDINILPSRTTILTTNIHIFYFLFLLTQGSTLNKHKFKLSFFILPKKKKTTIFLRAPYKNKLARLNIVQITTRMVLSVFYPTSSNSTIATVNLSAKYVGSIDLSSHKLKHVKTTISNLSTNINNYMYKSHTI